MTQFRLELCHCKVHTFWTDVLELRVSVSKLRNLGLRVKISYKEISYDPMGSRVLHLGRRARPPGELRTETEGLLLPRRPRTPGGPSCSCGGCVGSLAGRVFCSLSGLLLAVVVSASLPGGLRPFSFAVRGRCFVVFVGFCSSR